MTGTITEVVSEDPRLVIERPAFSWAHASSYDRHEFTVVEGDWARAVTLPNNIRGAENNRRRARELAARSRLFLDHGLLEEAIEATRGALRCHALARACERRVAEIRARPAREGQAA